MVAGRVEHVGPVRVSRVGGARSTPADPVRGRGDGHPDVPRLQLSLRVDREPASARDAGRHPSADDAASPHTGPAGTRWTAWERERTAVDRYYNGTTTTATTTVTTTAQETAGTCTACRAAVTAATVDSSKRHRCKRKLFGSRPSDHYFRSVCLFVCLCRVFLSRLRSDLDQTRTHVTSGSSCVP